MLSKEDKDTLNEYHFKLIVQNKKDTRMGTTVNMDGKDKIENVFILDTLQAIAQGLRDGETQFKDYLDRGIIKEDTDGEYILNAPKEHFIDMSQKEGEKDED